VKLPPVLGPATAGRALQPGRRVAYRAAWDKHWIAGLASLLAAFIVLTGVIALAWQLRPAGLRTGAPVTGSPAAPGLAPADPLATVAFKCSASIGLGISGAPQVAYVKAVGAKAYDGFERVTIEFANGRPQDVVLSLQQSSTFITDGPGGQSFVLEGQDGALVTIHGSDGHSDYHGPTDIKTKDSTVLELRQIHDSEGTVQWAIGLSIVACYRATFYDKPIRLVIDFQAGT